MTSRRPRSPHLAHGTSSPAASAFATAARLTSTRTRLGGSGGSTDLLDTFDDLVANPLLCREPVRNVVRVSVDNEPDGSDLLSEPLDQRVQSEDVIPIVMGHQHERQVPDAHGSQPPGQFCSVRTDIDHDGSTVTGLAARRRDEEDETICLTNVQAVQGGAHGSQSDFTGQAFPSSAVTLGIAAHTRLRAA